MMASGVLDVKSLITHRYDINNAIDAYNFIKSLRFATNISTNKNRLDFEAQVEISKKAKLGKRTTKKSVEMMMKKFYEMASSMK